MTSENENTSKDLDELIEAIRFGAIFAPDASLAKLQRALDEALAACTMGPEFEEAARDVVGTVIADLLEREDVHTTALASRLKKDRPTTEWMRRCRKFWRLLKGEAEPRTEVSQDELFELLALFLRGSCKRKLTAADVAEAFEATTTPMLFAAWLACEGHALGCGEEDGVYVGNTPECRRAARNTLAAAWRRKGGP